MSETMAGQVDAYTQGYDKGFEDGKKAGYAMGSNDMLKSIERYLDAQSEAMK